jgi:anti-sigma factor (TIGR02949 family)
MCENKVGVHREGSPYSEQECEEIIAKLELLLDGELDKTKESEVVEMVKNCDYCLEQYQIEKSLRKLVKNGFKNILMSANLVQKIKTSIAYARKSETKE